MIKNCPHCQEPLNIDPGTFAPDDKALIEYCHKCDGEIVVRRRAVQFEFTVEKA